RARTPAAYDGNTPLKVPGKRSREPCPESAHANPDIRGVVDKSLYAYLPKEGNHVVDPDRGQTQAGYVVRIDLCDGCQYDVSRMTVEGKYCVECAAAGDRGGLTNRNCH